MPKVFLPSVLGHPLDTSQTLVIAPSHSWHQQGISVLVPVAISHSTRSNAFMLSGTGLGVTVYNVGAPVRISCSGLTPGWDRWLKVTRRWIVPTGDKQLCHSYDPLVSCPTVPHVSHCTMSHFQSLNSVGRICSARADSGPWALSALPDSLSTDYLT